VQIPQLPNSKAGRQPVWVKTAFRKNAAAQERCEEFIMERIRGGRSIIGVYPSDEKTLLEYEEFERGRAGKG
jgi:hypothetical protein